MRVRLTDDQGAKCSGKVKNLGLSELLRIYLLKFIYKFLTEATNVRGLKDIEGS